MFFASGFERLKRILGLLAVPALLLLAVPGVARAQGTQETASGNEDEFTAFAAELEALREALHIPGMSAAVLRDQELVWAEGFGYADVENGIPATAETPYHLASVTKPVAATLIMQLVEEGVLNLDDPISQYGVHMQSTDITIRHLLTHTSGGVPGSEHDYDGNRYAYLAQVISSATGRPFGELLGERILSPLEMNATAPNPEWFGDGWAGYLAALGLNKTGRHIPDVYRAMARPYQFNEAYENVPGSYPLHFSPAAGLISSVLDLAKFDAALSRDELLAAETKRQMFTAALANNGQPLIYGLGWYTQEFKGTPLIWHSGGWPPSVSALMVKAPEENLTFIVLANNDNLSRPYRMGDGDVLYSTPALAFYKAFVFPRQFGKAVPAVDWSAPTTELASQLEAVHDPDAREVLEHELWSYRKLYASVGRWDDVERLERLHRRTFPEYTSSRRSPTAAGTNGPAGSPIGVSLLPEQVAGLSRMLFGWLLLTILSLALMFVLLARSRKCPTPLRIAWLFSTVLFGPLALPPYLASDGRKTNWSGMMRPRLRALGPAMFVATGNVAGLAFLLTLIVRFFLESDMGPAPALLSMFAFNWLVCLGPLAAWMRGWRIWKAWLRLLPLSLITTLLAAIGIVPVMFLSQAQLVGLNANGPFIYATLVVAGMAAALVVYPCVVWLVRKGSCYWLQAQGQGGAAADVEIDERSVMGGLLR